MARTTVLTPRIAQRLYSQLRKDGDFARSCNAVGVNVKTAYRWRERGEREADTIFAAFAAECTIAIGIGATKQIAAMRQDIAAPAVASVAAVIARTSASASAA